MKTSMSFFKEISKIPRGSGNCCAIANYIEQTAKDSNLRYIRDDKDNIIIFKNAFPGRENDKAVMLQGHTDMVCQQVEGKNHDFLCDSLELCEKDGYIYANGTTLGADDGAAVAIMLSLLKDENLNAPAIECVFTTDEEIGMLGAKSLDLSACRAAYLINADSEEEGVITCGSAGGATLEFSIPVERKIESGEYYRVIISGLTGGHSGTEINCDRQNAIKLMADVLDYDTPIVSITHNGKDNAIAHRCEAVVQGNENEIKTRLTKLHFENEKNLTAQVLPAERNTYEVLTEKSQKAVLDFLRQLPNGVGKMCVEPKGLVHTSDNIGIIKTEKNAVSGAVSARSCEEKSLGELSEKIVALAEKSGGKVQIHGEYSGWEYRKESELRECAVRIYERMTGKKAKIDVIHAGLECGVILSKMPWLDAISIGCNVYDIHTAYERMEIASFERTENFIRELLKELK